MFKNFSQEAVACSMLLIVACAFMGFAVFRTDRGTGPQNSGEVTKLRDDVNGLRMEVNRLNDRAGFNAGLDPDSVVRRDTFDRRPSAAKGVKP